MISAATLAAHGFAISGLAHAAFAKLASQIKATSRWAKGH
jgi:hypothetical protein